MFRDERLGEHIERISGRPIGKQFRWTSSSKAKEDQEIRKYDWRLEDRKRQAEEKRESEAKAWDSAAIDGEGRFRVKSRYSSDSIGTHPFDEQRSSINVTSVEKAINWTILLFQKYIGHNFPPTKLCDSSIDLSGGSGLPYKLTPDLCTKRDVIERGLINEEEILNHAAEVGRHFEPYYQWDCFPKIEILSAEKAKRKTRLICGASIEHCVLASYVSDSLNTAIHSKPLVCKSAVGLSMNRGGWDMLADCLGDGPLSESDAKQWDSSMHAYWLVCVYRIRRALMKFDDRDNEIFNFWLSELINSYFVTSHGDIHMVIGGNKSGSYNTCDDNTIGHIFLIAYSFSQCGLFYSDFESHFCAVFGDDLISQLLPRDFFYWYRSFGVVVPENKIVDIYSASFLSFRFLHTPYGIMPYHVNSKMLYSAYNHDTKIWRSIRKQKLFILYILNFWHSDAPIYKELLDIENIEYDINNIIRYWSGLVKDGGGFNLYIR
nr:hypothetical protein [Leuven wasp-associated virus 7]